MTRTELGRLHGWANHRLPRCRNRRERCPFVRQINLLRLKDKADAQRQIYLGDLSSKCSRFHVWHHDCPCDRWESLGYRHESCFCHRYQQARMDGEFF